MKVFNREQFLKLPAGTIYAKARGSEVYSAEGKSYEPHILLKWEELSVKEETSDDEKYFLTYGIVGFETCSQISTDLEILSQYGDSEPINEMQHWDKDWEGKAYFLVYEYDDLCKLQELAERAKTVSKGDGGHE